MGQREEMQKTRLVQRWKQIEDLEGSEENPDNDDDEFKCLKEEWFSDAFNFLHNLSEDEHCWCAHKDVILPLLEPFYNLPEDTSPNSILRMLWGRVSQELGKCTRCIVQHHKAKEFYRTEFLEDVVGPLLAILQELDEERVACHLKELLKRVETKTFNSDTDSTEVICVMFEILMFPSLLEDAEVNEAFRPFLQYVESTHDLTLAGGQRYPGVYALLLHADQSVRRIATGLAKSLDSFKDAQDLEAIQPILQKVMHCLENDVFDSGKKGGEKGRVAVGVKGNAPPVSHSLRGETSRPRVGLTREGLWLGLPTILGRLEPRAFEEGVVERYPVFVSIVLNYVSEATTVLWQALRCLHLLFEVLGYKLWLRTTFSAGVMRNTLLSQCFHSHEELMHMKIFELFQPFLESLEALQDGEYERQRRRLLYFLLQQVPCSSNFTSLTSKKARQIAFSIIGRGYTMDPPLPPLDCAHVWGPPLVATLKDTCLHQSLRQPAIELFQSILVADAAALASLSGKSGEPPSLSSYLLDTSRDDDDLETAGDGDMAGDVKYWFSFKKVSESVGEDSENWSCVPLLWMEVLDGTMPSHHPASFSKAVLWALARLAVVDPPTGPPPDDLLVSHAGVAYSEGLAAALQWERPKGYDDKSDSKSCVNAFPAESSCSELVGIFKRCADGYIGRLRDGKLVDGWLWEPRFAEPLLLLLLDSNSIWRNFGRDVLRRYADDSSLEMGLELLCSSQSSVNAVGRGVLHVSKLLLTWPFPKCSRALSQLFFLGYKLLTLGQRPPEGVSSSHNQMQPVKTSQDGGFLRQPVLSQQTLLTQQGNPAAMTQQKDESAWRKLCGQVSSFLLPLLAKAIIDGKEHVQDARQELTFTRLLQLLPLVCKHLSPFVRTQLFGVPNRRSNMSQSSGGLKWFQQLVEWGRISSRSIHRWWKDAVFTIVEDLAQCGPSISPELSATISQLLQPGCCLEDDQRLQLGSIFKLFSPGNMDQGDLENLPVRAGQQKPLSFLEEADDTVEFNIGKPDVIDLDSDEEDIPIEMTSVPRALVIETGPLADKSQMLEPLELGPVGASSLRTRDCLAERREAAQKFPPEEFVVGEEGEAAAEEDSVPLTSLFSQQHPIQKRPVAVRKSYVSGTGRNNFTTLDKFLLKDPKSASWDSQSGFQATGEGNRGVSQTFRRLAPKLPKANASKAGNKLASLRAEHRVDLEQRAAAEPSARSQVRERVLSKTVHLPEVSARLSLEKARLQEVAPRKELIERRPPPVLIPETDPILQELVMDNDSDPLAKALDSARKPSTQSLKDVNQPRRQIITLQMPGEQGRLGGGVRTPASRGPPPRLDEWFQWILAIDYFSVTGMGEFCPESDFSKPLVKVPLTFESTQKYLEVFQPLVLEEFKAQLQRSHGELALADGMTTGVLRLMSLERVDTFQLGRFMADGGADGAARACIENDLLLLTRQPLRLGEPQSCHMLAKVERRERENKSRATIVLLKLYLHTGNSRLVKAKRLLVDRSKWHITRILSLTPQLREFQALSAAGSLPLLPTILCPAGLVRDPSALLTGLQSLPMALQSKLRGDYNESQLCAIAAAIGKRGSAATEHQLALVQGPPGTGKTRTIVAIVSALLTGGRQLPTRSGKENQSISFQQRNSNGSVSFPRRSSMQESAALARAWQDAALAREIHSTGNEAHGVGVSSDTGWGGPHKHRVLVCAQSNAAVDELVARMCKHGLYGADGNYFRPTLVRVGNVKTVHPDSMPVFMDTLVEERLGAEKQSAADAMEEVTQKRTAVLRTKLEEVIEGIQVLESLHSQRERGEKGDDVSGGHGEETKARMERQSRSSDNEVCQSDAVKQATRVMQEGEEAVKAKLNSLYRQRRELSMELASAEKEARKLMDEGRAKRQAIRKTIIREADVVVTTLSGCGGDIYAACMESVMGNKKARAPSDDGFFSAVVIDEAAQALEPATLIPLQLLAQTHARCVMVGDPKQLPATVLSQEASKMSYECSMFERLQRAGYPVMMLSTQYRMHPEIRQFPSVHFYENQLTDGLREGSRSAPFHKDWCFGPYVFFDVVEGYERTKSTSVSQSLCNEAEAEAALGVFQALKHRYSAEVRPGRFGVITPYKQQLSLLRNCFIRALGSGAACDIEFNTVDGFQGREVDILILSTVRATTGRESNRNGEVNRGSIGFVADVRRMNVALTRARFSLWIVGNAATLQGSPPWAALLSNAKERHVLFPIKRPYVFEGEPLVDTSRLIPRNVPALATKLVSDHMDVMTSEKHSLTACKRRDMTRERDKLFASNSEDAVKEEGRQLKERGKREGEACLDNAIEGRCGDSGLLNDVQTERGHCNGQILKTSTEGSWQDGEHVQENRIDSVHRGNKGQAREVSRDRHCEADGRKFSEQHRRENQRNRGNSGDERNRDHRRERHRDSDGSREHKDRDRSKECDRRGRRRAHSREHQSREGHRGERDELKDRVTLLDQSGIVDGSSRREGEYSVPQNFNHVSSPRELPSRGCRIDPDRLQLDKRGKEGYSRTQRIPGPQSLRESPAGTSDSRVDWRLNQPSAEVNPLQFNTGPSSNQNARESKRSAGFEEIDIEHHRGENPVGTMKHPEAERLGKSARVQLKSSEVDDGSRPRQILGKQQAHETQFAATRKRQRAEVAAVMPSGFISSSTGTLLSDRPKRGGSGNTIQPRAGSSASREKHGDTQASERRPLASAVSPSYHNEHGQSQARVDSKLGRPQTSRHSNIQEAPFPLRHQLSSGPPPFKRQKDLERGRGQGTPMCTTVDDILSGLDSLSRAQVKGRKEPGAASLNASRRPPHYSH